MGMESDRHQVSLAKFQGWWSSSRQPRQPADEIASQQGDCNLPCATAILTNDRTRSSDICLFLDPSQSRVESVVIAPGLSQIVQR